MRKMPRKRPRQILSIAQLSKTFSLAHPSRPISETRKNNILFHHGESAGVATLTKQGAHQAGGATTCPSKKGSHNVLEIALEKVLIRVLRSRLAVSVRGILRTGSKKELLRRPFEKQKHAFSVSAIACALQD